MKLNEQIQAQMPEEIAALQGLLRIRSVENCGENGTIFGQGAQDCLDYCLTLSERLGFHTQDVDRYCGYAEHGSGEELIVVLGHLDVVPEGDGWTHPPYGAEIADGKLYGRGAIDDKGPMIAALYALHAIRACEIPLKRRIRILFGINEETGCECIRHYVRSGQELPLMGFTPDGNFPIINGEKGIAVAEYTHSLAQTARSIRSFTGGTAFNMVPANACAILNWPEHERAAICAMTADGIRITAIDDGLKLEASGMSAHGSTPEKGVNAITKLAAFLAALPLDSGSAQFARFIAENYAQGTRGEALGIALEDTVSGGMAVNLGTARTENGAATLCVNLRCPVTFGEADFHPALTAAMAAGGFAETAFRYENALYMPPESPLIQTLQTVYEQQTGQPAELLCIGGGTYAKLLPNTVAFGPIFPGEPCVEHEPDEYITLENLRRCTEIFAAAMVALAR